MSAQLCELSHITTAGQTATGAAAAPPWGADCQPAAAPAHPQRRQQQCLCCRRRRKCVSRNAACRIIPSSPAGRLLDRGAPWHAFRGDAQPAEAASLAPGRRSCATSAAAPAISNHPRSTAGPRPRRSGMHRSTGSSPLWGRGGGIFTSSETGGQHKQQCSAAEREGCV